MKLIYTFIVSVFISGCSLSQESNQSTKSVEKVLHKLASDTLSFDQFVLLGKCQCMDMVDSSNFYKDTYIQLFNFQTPLARLFNMTDIKTELETYINSQIDTEFSMLRARDEKIVIRSIVLCDRVFSTRNQIWSVYKSFLSKGYLKMTNPEYFNFYLNDSGYVNNNNW